MNKHILYLNYILYIYRSDKFIWRKLRANILAAVFLHYSTLLYVAAEAFSTGICPAEGDFIWLNIINKLHKKFQLWYY